ncbi:1440_t:CDS:2 [Gigaspora rosea]|nr:1440_t:CDS:2 [Gigaspora rosea]
MQLFYSDDDESTRKMRPWSNTEITRFSMLCQKHGRDWNLISRFLERTPKECYHKYSELDPGFRRQPFRIVRRRA